jgi:hypothetical protein
MDDYIITSNNNDYISFNNTEETKEDFKNFELMEEFNNVLNYKKNDDNNFYVYIYDWNDRHYCNFLHFHDLPFVINYLNHLLKNGYDVNYDGIYYNGDKIIFKNSVDEVANLIDFDNNDDCNCVMGGNIFNSVAEFFRSGVNRIVNIVTKPLIRRDAPPYYREFLERYGNIKINEIWIGKTPIQKTFDSLINIISLGKWSQTKNNLNYDDMFHLYIIFKLEGNITVRNEKNEVLSINLLDNEDYKKNKHIFLSNYLNMKPVNINDLHKTALKNVGPERLYLYKGDSTNCQLFIHDLLFYSGIYNDEIDGFVMQKAGTLVSSLPILTQKIMQGATDAASFFNTLIYGAGLMNNKQIIKLKHGGSLMIL